MIKANRNSNSDGTIHVKTSCDSCGKQIVKTSPLGMDCEDDCAKKEFIKQLKSASPAQLQFMKFIVGEKAFNDTLAEAQSQQPQK